MVTAHQDFDGSELSCLSTSAVISAEVRKIVCTATLQLAAKLIHAALLTVTDLQAELRPFPRTLEPFSVV